MTPIQVGGWRISGDPGIFLPQIRRRAYAKYGSHVLIEHGTTPLLQAQAINNQMIGLNSTSISSLLTCNCIQILENIFDGFGSEHDLELMTSKGSCIILCDKPLSSPKQLCVLWGPKDTPSFVHR